MQQKVYISFIVMALCISTGFAQSAKPAQNVRFDFYGDTIELPIDPAVRVTVAKPISHQGIQDFYTAINAAAYQPMIESLLAFRNDKKLDDWLYYQLIRSMAEQLSPKAADYHRYTLYKWFLLNKSGYEATTRLRNDTLLLYVHSEETIYDIPNFVQDGKQFVCLNYHDYGSNIAFEGTRFTQTALQIGGNNPFSYKITSLPDMKASAYTEKALSFAYGSQEYSFRVMLNNQVKTLFTNYPVVDYAAQFNIPLSKTTYQSLIPLLRNAVKGMSQKNGVDYLMHFTRSAFVFETDTRAFGKEKRLSPEQTLLYDYSDCEDRSAFFFFLVKEIYQLPMIVLSYPSHITVAVQFDHPMGNPIVYKGNQYWVCEPTPQKKDLKLGQLLPSLKKQAYEVVYEYRPH